MRTHWTCNNFFWTREDYKVFENNLALNFNYYDLFRTMEEALSKKSVDEIKDHYNTILEDIDAIDYGRHPLPNIHSCKALLTKI